jgi:hypothetical protein
MNAQAQTIITPPEERRRERATTVIPATPSNPMEMLALAVAQGADLAKIEKLMDLQERWDKGQAQRAFVEAMAKFKAEPVHILKTKDVNIPGGAKFKHATLADVVDGIVGNLSKYGLSHRWVTEQQDKNAVTVRCVLTHVAGHSEECVLQAAPDDSGKKNNIQQVASTVTYLQRYTLMSICGLAAKDMDNDGNNASGGKQQPQRPKEPEGYEKWSMDMDALAEEGKAKHLAAWTKSNPEFRNYATRHDLDWWTRSKNKAARAGE